ncbi:MAG: WYL domain-containing protein [bacterium]|nr:WYL domain-containing protein [bacterium]
MINRDDGSIILEMKTSGWWDVKKWVLSYGAEAKVLEPEKFRDEIAAELEKSLGQYR